MASNKNFKIKAEDLVEIIPNMGGCIATDTITVDGLPVKYMYRSEPVNDMDNGWRFFSGTESQEYIDDLENSGIYDVNTIANYEPAIILHLDLPIGTELERDEDANTFHIIVR